MSYISCFQLVISQFEIILNKLAIHVLKSLLFICLGMLNIFENGEKRGVLEIEIKEGD